MRVLSLFLERLSEPAARWIDAVSPSSSFGARCRLSRPVGCTDAVRLVGRDRGTDQFRRMASQQGVTVGLPPRRRLPPPPPLTPPMPCLLIDSAPLIIRAPIFILDHLALTLQQQDRPTADNTCYPRSLARRTPHCRRPDWALAGAFATVFGVQRLVPTFKADWYKALRKPSWTPPNYAFPLGENHSRTTGCSTHRTAPAEHSTRQLLTNVHLLPPACSATPCAVWIPLKVLQSVAQWLVWRAGEGDARRLAAPLTLFGAHLFLGNAWNVSRWEVPLGGPGWSRRGGRLRHGQAWSPALVQGRAGTPACRKRRTCALRHACMPPPPRPPSCILQVVFFGRHRLQDSLGWMGAFWASIAASIAAFSQVWWDTGGGGGGGCVGGGSALGERHAGKPTPLPARYVRLVPTCFPLSPLPAGLAAGSAAVCAHPGVGHHRGQAELGHCAAQPRRRAGRQEGVSESRAASDAAVHRQPHSCCCNIGC